MKKIKGVTRVVRVEVTIDPRTITDEPMTEGEMQHEAEAALKGIFSRGMRRGGIGSGVCGDPVVDLSFIEFEEFCPKCEDSNIHKTYVGLLGPMGGYKCRCHACEHQWEETGSWEKRRDEAAARVVTYAVPL